MLDPNEKNKGEIVKEVTGVARKAPATELTAFAFDRDKNIFYLASDESVDEILDADGYHVVHANRELNKKSSHEN